MSNKSTKKALLTSVLALVLCMSMLIGTTFAWFTDEVKSGTNIIAAGNLDVNLYHSDRGEQNKPVNAGMTFPPSCGNPALSLTKF